MDREDARTPGTAPRTAARPHTPLWQQDDRESSGSPDDSALGFGAAPTGGDDTALVLLEPDPFDNEPELLTSIDQPSPAAARKGTQPGESPISGPAVSGTDPALEVVHTHPAARRTAAQHRRRHHHQSANPHAAYLPPRRVVGRGTAVDTALQEWATSLSVESGNSLDAVRASTVLFRDVMSSNEPRPSPLRTAACALMLERICNLFSRYQSVLSRVQQAIIEGVYVQDCEESRRLIGAVDYDLDTKYEALAPYNRKTYFQAYDELCDRVRQYTRLNHTMEVRLSRQPAVFDRAVKHWTSSVLRNYFQAWRKQSKKSKALRIKYRSVFLRLRGDECKQRAIRRWRERAMARRQLSMDGDVVQELSTVKKATKSLHEEVQSLMTYNGSLSNQITELKKTKQVVANNIKDKEQRLEEIKTMCDTLVNAGNECLDTALVKRYPPPGATPVQSMVAWANSAVAYYGALDDAATPFNDLLAEGFTATMPLSAFAVLLQWFESDSSPSREDALRVHTAPSPTEQVALLLPMVEELLGRKCIVPEDQLVSKQRPALLFLLATLMRHLADWIQTKPPSALMKSQLPANDHTVWEERVRMQRQWINVSLAAYHTCVELVLRPTKLLTAEETKDLQGFVELRYEKISDLLGATDTVQFFSEVIRAVRRVYPEMRRIFYHYSVPKMSFMDLVRLLKDVRILVEPKFPRKWADAIYREVKRPPSPGLSPASPSSVAGDEAKKEGGPQDADFITPLEYTEFLVRLGVKLYGRPGDGNTHAHFLRLVTDRVIPFAQQSNTDKFHSMTRHPTTLAVIAEHKTQLRRAFGKYAGDSFSDIDLETFLTFAQKSGWVTKKLHLDALTNIFRRVQADHGNRTDFHRMDFNEWLDALVAATPYHYPNPFCSFHQRLELFVQEQVIAPFVQEENGQ